MLVGHVTGKEATQVRRYAAVLSEEVIHFLLEAAEEQEGVKAKALGHGRGEEGRGVAVPVECEECAPVHLTCNHSA